MREATLTQAAETTGLGSSFSGVTVDEFKEFLRTDTSTVIGFARRLMGDDESGRDLAQDALIKAFRHLDSFRGEASLKTWVIRITVNEGLKRLRRRRLKEKVAGWFVSGQDNHRPLGYGLRRSKTPEQEAGLSEQARFLDEALQSLPDRQRTVVLLRYVEGMSVAEIAQATGVGQGTVKTHLARALRKIRSLRDRLEREV